MLGTLLTINFAVMILAPIALALFLWRRYQTRWLFWIIGAGTFIVAQIGHIPFNAVMARWLPTDTSTTLNLVIIAVFAGLSAGVFEEVARYFAYRWVAKDARRWKDGMKMGAGHGGIEAILLGVIGGVNAFILLTVLADDPHALGVIPAEQLDLLAAQIASLQNLSWYEALLGGLERLFAITLHLSLSLMVMQVFVRRNIRWLFAAIGWHALVNAAAVITVTTWGALAAEAVLAALTIVSLAIILRLRVEPAGSTPQQPDPLPAMHTGPVDLTVSTDKLDDSRYS